MAQTASPAVRPLGSAGPWRSWALCLGPLLPARAVPCGAMRMIEDVPSVSLSHCQACGHQPNIVPHTDISQGSAPSAAFPLH